ncbi:hypothetical protein EC957_002855 [Mortierella hygrophila]|uniref:Zn(2)-C6 fungal-type domain-containing protein n=1 Tax=Mortierella hygrophila TaxID=979708 RepID=A0A9P6FFR8_9FUNG|nr:hypothetical protein EC957_002855 [Mortierella hygrophila]
MGHIISADFLAATTGFSGMDVRHPSAPSSGTASETTQSRYLLKCDGGVPCASCLKKNVDCRYTDAQLSRATWGDSLFSDEKVIGVVADKPKTQLFYTGVNPLQSQDPRSEAIRSQSKHHSRLIRVAHPGPQFHLLAASATGPGQGRTPSHQNGHQQPSPAGARSGPLTAATSTSSIASSLSSISSTDNDHLGLSTQQQQAVQSCAKGGFQEFMSGATVSQSQPSSVNNPPLEQYATKGSLALQQDHPGHHQIMDEEYIKARRVQKMAKDLIDIKRNEYALLIPRHILHEDDELFVIRNPQANPKPQRIPPRLMIVPRDANYLVEVFFENAHFYYPIVNRAAVELCLMESHTPNSMLLLNTVFMVACKHLPRIEDTIRAIEFRERVRELRWCIEDRTQLTFMLAEMMGFMAVYGLFGMTTGKMEYCGTHRTFASKNSGAQVSHPETELVEEEFPKGSLVEVNHQYKLWLFWAHYLRDSIAMLYFGSYFGIDTKPMTAELPKITNFVGLGGRVAPSVNATPIATVAAAAAVATKRRREVFFGPRTAHSDKRRLLPDPKARVDGDLSDRTQFRSMQGYSAGSDDSGDDEGSTSPKAGSDRGPDVAMNPNPANGVEGPSGAYGAGGANLSGRNFATLSKEVLEAQSRGNSILHGMSEIAETLDPEVLVTHMERMEILLRSQDDPTDGGSYARALFLEEVRLWIIGRRISVYLASRTTGDTPHHPVGLPGQAANDSTGTSSSTARRGLGCWSEQAWKEDLKLQSLQADLIAWEKAVPDHLKFRLDVDHSDVNQKINGKMAIIMMAYYTITILLQTSYLPALPVPSHPKPSPKKPSPQASNYDGSNKDADSRHDAATSQRLGSRSRSNSDVSKESPRSLNAPPTSSTSFTRSTSPLSTAGDGYYNTPHRICTELANVLFHHVEIMLDRYTEWCSIQAKINHAIIAAQRVVCLNVRLEWISCAMHNEAKAAFKMGSALYKKLAMLPAPLVIHDRPPEEDLNYMNDLDKAFHHMVVTQNEERENKRLSNEREQERQEQQEELERENRQGPTTVLNSFVLDADDQDGVPTTDEIHSQGFEIFGGEVIEGYAFDFEETSISMKGSFSFLLDPNSITE